MIWAYCLTSNHVHKEEYDGVMIDEARTSARTECPCGDEGFISRIEEPQMGAIPIRSKQLLGILLRKTEKSGQKIG